MISRFKSRCHYLSFVLLSCHLSLLNLLKSLPWRIQKSLFSDLIAWCIHINVSHGTTVSSCGTLPFQEQMKQQQWQQQQQQGGLPPTVPSQPSSGAVPPPTHRPLYQPVQPHPQHLASMGFDPRWLVMQSYMDPRMMSGRAAVDIPPIHPGECAVALSPGLLALLWHQSFSSSLHG